MKTIKINNQQFKIQDIKQLYPAGLVNTGNKDETTPMSLEWIDTESKGKVKINSYIIVLIDNNGKKNIYNYKTRELLDKAMKNLANQFN